MPIKSLGSNAAPPPPSADPGRARKKMDEKKLRQAGEDFEALFINQLLQGMRRTVFKSKILGDAPGKEVYQSLFDRELSKKMAHQGGLGLGKIMVQKVLEKESRKSSPPTGALQPTAVPAMTGTGRKL
jgi:Rod binding domain-containing protein